MPADPEAAFEWDRRGAPQVRHPHVFLGLARTILRDRFPDVLQDLTDLGITPPLMRSGDGPMAFDEETLALIAADDDLRMLPVRRTTFEWVMRRTVLAEPNVELLVGRGVAGVELDAVRRAARPPSPACDWRTGRCSPPTSSSPPPAVEATCPPGSPPTASTIPETVGDAGVIYFSRFYRAPAEHGFGFRGGVRCRARRRRDRLRRRHLLDHRRHRPERQGAARSTSATQLASTPPWRCCPSSPTSWRSGGTPIHEVHSMTGLVNRTRSFTDAAGIPLVRGVIAVGDAHTCTNPAYGRGQSLALRQAVLLADALAEQDDLLEAARAYEAQSEEQVVPWYHFSVLTDQMRQAAVASGADPRSGGGDPFARGVRGAGGDPELIRLVLRVMNLLELPTAAPGQAARAAGQGGGQPPADGRSPEGPDDEAPDPS